MMGGVKFQCACGGFAETEVEVSSPEMYLECAEYRYTAYIGLR